MEKSKKIIFAVIAVVVLVVIVISTYVFTNKNDTEIDDVLDDNTIIDIDFEEAPPVADFDESQPPIEVESKK